MVKKAVAILIFMSLAIFSFALSAHKDIKKSVEKGKFRILRKKTWMYRMNEPIKNR